MYLNLKLRCSPTKIRPKIHKTLPLSNKRSVNRDLCHQLAEFWSPLVLQEVQNRCSKVSRRSINRPFWRSRRIIWGRLLNHKWPKRPGKVSSTFWCNGIWSRHQTISTMKSCLLRTRKTWTGYSQSWSSKIWLWSTTQAKCKSSMKTLIKERKSWNQKEIESFHFSERTKSFTGAKFYLLWTTWKTCGLKRTLSVWRKRWKWRARAKTLATTLGLTCRLKLIAS